MRVFAHRGGSGAKPNGFECCRIVRFFLLCLILACAVTRNSAASYTSLHPFTGAPNDGSSPQYGSLVTDGTVLYGMTSTGGSVDKGVLFKITTNGSGYRLIHSFGGLSVSDVILGGSGDPNDGATPYGTPLIVGSTLYGMTLFGGTNGTGAIFRMNTDGSGFQLLHSFGAGFGPRDGYAPYCALVTDGTTLYGMTSSSMFGSGEIFAIGLDGSNYRDLHDFVPNVNDGANPRGALLLSGSVLYGMTLNGGANGLGTIFRISVDGSSFQLLHSFSSGSSDGASPCGSLILSNSTLFGTTSSGGGNNRGTIFRMDASGSNFQLLHSFSAAEGGQPMGDLVLSNATLFGMAGGSNGAASGTIFQIDTDGSDFQTAHTFLYSAQNPTDGSEPIGSLILVGSRFYGMTRAGGGNRNLGSIFSFAAGATDSTKPTLKVSAPTPKFNAIDSPFTANGIASDNVGVAEVFYQLNGEAWTAAVTSNNWANWSAANLMLNPGANVFKVYAQDLSGNVSATNTVTFTYSVSAPIVVNTNGAGSIKPSLNGEMLEIGKTFSMTAKAAKGYAFVNWTGSATTTSTKLSFIMASNLTFIANFKDVARPVNAILSPTKNQNVTNAVPVVTGKAMDNVGVAAVWFRVNGGNWMQANLPNGTNWTTPDLSSSLLSGLNNVGAFAVDATGNASLTTTIVFTYTVQPSADWAPDSLNGLAALVTPANGSGEIVGFDLSTFSQASTGNSSAPEDYGAGSYSYLKVDTNLAQLSLNFTAPPASSNSVGPIDIVFTNHYVAYFSNEAGGDVGGFALKIATNFVPASVVGKALNAVSSRTSKTVKIKLSTATTFTKTPSNNSNSGSSSGNYTFTRFSPVSGLFTFAFTDLADAGEVAYVQLTFTSATGGTYFLMSFDGFGNFQDVDMGQFTL